MIETQRLYIKPLSHTQLAGYIKNDGSLERSLGLQPSLRQISADLQEALESTILPKANEENPLRLFSTLWTLIHKSEQVMVGDACFIGPPDAAGEVEIGYGTYEQHQGKGYMTEAVEALIHWVSFQPNVRSVYAATEKNNPASGAVLLKNGFVQFDETGGLFQWRKVLEAAPK